MTRNKDRATEKQKRDREARGKVVRIRPTSLVDEAAAIATARGKGWSAGRVFRDLSEAGIHAEYAKLTGAKS